MDRYLLKNGLTVLLEESSSKLATLIVTVRTGSNEEPVDQKGISHFLEHMVFEGTSTRDSLQITKAIEGLGGEIGAFTSNEETCFYVRILPRYVSTALEILYDILVNPSFDPVVLEKERRVVLNEINMKHDEPRFYQWELFLNRLYENQPPSFPISGSIDSVSKISRKMLFEYYKTHYVPNNMIVAYTGPNKSMHKKIARTFAGLLPQKLPIFSYSQKLVKTSSANVLRQINQSYLVYGFQTVERSHVDSFVLDVIRSLLGRGMSGTLVHEIRTMFGMAYEVGVQNEANRDYGFFAIYLSTDKKNIKKCLGIINRQIDDLKLSRISDSEFLEAKNFLEGEFMIMMEDNQKSAIAKSIWENSRMVEPIGSYIKRVRSVSKHDIQRVARIYFHDVCIATVQQSP